MMIRWSFVVGAVVLLSGGLQGAWSGVGSATVRVGFDSNVFLQDRAAPLTADTCDATADAGRQSATLGLGLLLKAAWKSDLGKAEVSYALEATWFADASGEDNVAHRFSASGSVRQGAWEPEFRTAFTWIDGSRQALVFNREGGAPAVGGIPARDRREQWFTRNSVRLTARSGKVFGRMGAAAYVHDFRTFQSATPVGYQNFADRAEYGVIAAGGVRVLDRLDVGIGYRGGRQTQGRVLEVPLRYDNTYQRIVAEFEGEVVRGVRVNLAVGPDFRNFEDNVRAGFDRTQVRTFGEGTLTWDASSKDRVSLVWRHFMQPAAGGRSVYDDVLYEATYRRVVAKAWTTSLTARSYLGDMGVCLASPARKDWIHSVSASVGWQASPRLRVEATYLHDLAESRVPVTQGREYHRDVWSLAVTREL